MISHDRAARMVAKEIQALRNEAPLPPTPYVVMEIASRLHLAPWEGYDANLSYLANIRIICDHVLRGGFSERHEERDQINVDRCHFDDPYGTYVDWGNAREARGFIDRFLLGASKHEKLKRQLSAA